MIVLVASISGIVVRGSEPGLACLVALLLYLESTDVLPVESPVLGAENLSSLDSLLALLFSLLVDSGGTENILGRLLCRARWITVGSSWPAIYDSDIFVRIVETGSSRVVDTGMLSVANSKGGYTSCIVTEERSS